MANPNYPRQSPRRPAPTNPPVGSGTSDEPAAVNNLSFDIQGSNALGVTPSQIRALLELGWSEEEILGLEGPNTVANIIDNGWDPEGYESRERGSQYYDPLSDYIADMYTEPEEEQEEVPDHIEYDPNADDILAQMQERWGEGFSPIANAQIQEASNYRDALSALGSDYADQIRGSDALKGLQNYASEMRGIYDQGGLTDVTKANLERARRQEDQWIRAQREAALQDLAERGMSGGGAEVAALAADRAAAASRMSAADLDTLSFAQQQALEALASSDQANRNLFDIDKGISDTQLLLGKQGENEAFDITRAMNDAGISAWNTIYGDFLRNRGDTWGAARDGVVDASTRVVNTLGGATERNQGNVTNTISSDTRNLEGYGTGLTGFISSPGPTLSSVKPPAPYTAGADLGTAIGGGIETVAAIAGAAGMNSTIDDEQEEEK